MIGYQISLHCSHVHFTSPFLDQFSEISEGQFFTFLIVMSDKSRKGATGRVLSYIPNYTILAIGCVVLLLCMKWFLIVNGLKYPLLWRNVVHDKAVYLGYQKAVSIHKSVNWWHQDSKGYILNCYLLLRLDNEIKGPARERKYKRLINWIWAPAVKCF